MKLNELFKDAIVRLPKSYDNDFKNFVEELIGSYYQKVVLLDFPNEEKSEALKNLTRLIDDLKNTLNEYYNGHPHSAYRILDETINDCKLFNYWKEHTHSRNFFRLRTDAKQSLERKDLFHIPFHERGKVRTQRYSIPGYPS